MCFFAFSSKFRSDIVFFLKLKSAVREFGHLLINAHNNEGHDQIQESTIAGIRFIRNLSAPLLSREAQVSGFLRFRRLAVGSLSLTTMCAYNLKIKVPD